MKFVLITEASGGIGEALAREFAKRKKNLILVARSQDKLEKITVDLQKNFGIEIKFFAQDLSKLNSAEILFASLKGLSIEALINNAGFGLGGTFESQNLQLIEEMLLLNIMTLTKLTHLLIPKLKETNGTILNVASTAAFQPVPYLATYAATKAYVLHWSEALGAELKNDGVFVTALCPGATETGFFKAADLEKNSIPLPFQKVEDVVSTAMSAIDHKQPVAVSGWRNKVTVVSGKFVPRSWVVAVSEKLMRGQH